jgi:putative flippase GtrA
VLSDAPPLTEELPGSAAQQPGRAVCASRRPWLTESDAVAASFLRFVVVGGSSNVVYVLAFWLLAGSGTQLANTVGFLASTALANELHRRLTFHARGSIRWYTAQLEGGGLALTGLAITSLALAGFARVADHPSTVLQAALVVAVTGLVGLMRFLALRAWFRPVDPPEKLT